MKKLKFIGVLVSLVASAFWFVACGVVTHEEGSCEGYTLYCVGPNVAADYQRATLIDMDGNIVEHSQLKVGMLSLLA